MRFDILKLFVMISPKEFSMIKMLLDDFLEFFVSFKIFHFSRFFNTAMWKCYPVSLRLAYQ